MPSDIGTPPGRAADSALLSRPSGDAEQAEPEGSPSYPPDVEEIYRLYATRVYAVAMRMLGNEVDAEDVTQEVILQVIRRLGTFRGESSLTTWLYRVTVNAVLLLRRKRAVAKERHFSQAGTGDDGPSPLETPAPTRRPATRPEDELTRRELAERMESAIARLPAAYRDPFILSDVEGLPNAEICAMLGLSLPAVKSRLHRARLLLRDALGPYVGDKRTPR